MLKKLPSLFFFILLLLNFCANAQVNSITKAQAFFRQSTAGTIPVDENGRPTAKSVKKDYKIYIETKGSVLPQWQTAIIDGIPYAIHALEIKTASLDVGQLKGKGTVITITKRKGNQLWQLLLTPQPSDVKPTDDKQSTSPILLAGTYKGKAFTYKISKIQELAKRFNP
jgi:hypothetical protein